MRSEATARAGYRFVAAWLVACVLGGLLNAPLQLSALAKVYEVIGFSPTQSPGFNRGLYLESLLESALFATFTVGLAGFVLGRRLRRIELPWLGATVAFAAVAYVASFAIEDQLALVAVSVLPSAVASLSPVFPLSTYPFIAGAFSGLVIGLGQTFVLARYLRYPAWWIAASCLAFGLAAGLTATMEWLFLGADGMNGPNSYLVQLFMGAVGRPLVIGVVGGIALMFPLRNERIPVSRAVVGPSQV